MADGKKKLVYLIDDSDNVEATASLLKRMGSYDVVTRPPQPKGEEPPTIIRHFLGTVADIMERKPDVVVSLDSSATLTAQLIIETLRSQGRDTPAILSYKGEAKPASLPRSTELLDSETFGSKESRAGRLLEMLGRMTQSQSQGRAL